MLSENSINEEIVEVKRASQIAVIFYSFGDLASQFVWTFIGSYLTIFYTDIVGLAPGIAAAIMLGARVWDAINDPMMGAIAERTRSKFGRFRPYIAFGSPLLAIFSVLCFTAPFSGSSTAGVVWSAVIYIITGMLYTLVNIPYGALAAVMSEDSDQRNKINVSRNIGMQLGVLLVNAVAAGMMLNFSGAGAEVANGRGYLMTALIFAIISVPLFLAVFFTSKEQIVPTEAPGKFSLKEMISNLVNNKYLMLLFVIMAVQMTALMGRIAVIIYYIIYCLGSFSLIAVIMTLVSISGIIGSLFVPKAIQLFGKRNTMMAAFIIQGISLIGVYLTPFDNITMIVIASCFYGLFNITFPCSLSMLADAVDWYDLKSGVRTDGTAYSAYGLAQKMGNAIGASLGVLLMASFGYVANVQQTPEALNGINVVTNLMPAILSFVAAAACIFWKLTDNDADEIRAKIRLRNKGN